MSQRVQIDWNVAGVTYVEEFGLMVWPGDQLFRLMCSFPQSFNADGGLLAWQSGVESWWGRDLCTLPDRPRGPPGLCIGYLVSFPGVKRPGRVADTHLHLAPRCKKEQSYTSTPPPLGLHSQFWGDLNVDAGVLSYCKPHPLPSNQYPFYSDFILILPWDIAADVMLLAVRIRRY